MVPVEYECKSWDWIDAEHYAIGMGNRNIPFNNKILTFLCLTNMNDFGKFLVYMFVATIVFVLVLHFTLRKRTQGFNFKIILLALIAVVGGMTFARITYGKGVPWWIFYGLPALITFVLPPLVLRMSKRELLFYIPVSVLLAPAIHIFFSFFFGWHDYMPLFYVPCWHELL
jgi:hypothetical protein